MSLKQNYGGFFWKEMFNLKGLDEYKKKNNVAWQKIKNPGGPKMFNWAHIRVLAAPSLTDALVVPSGCF